MNTSEHHSHFPDISGVSTDGRRTLLNQKAYAPRALLFLGALPHLILFLFNLSTYLLFIGDLEQTQHFKWAGMLGANLAVMGAYLYGYYHLHSRGLLLRWKLLFAALLIPVTYLACSSILSFQWENPLIPRAAARWLITDDTFLIRQLTFTMPGILLSVVLLGGYPFSGLEGKDQGDSKLAFGLLALGGILFAIFYFGTGFIGGSIGAVAFMILTAAIGILIGAGLIRLLLVLMRAVASSTSDQLPLAFLITLALPITGLIVNYHIPFPSTFQSYTIYGICVLNGIALLIPPLKFPRAELILWLTRCALFAFTLYFVALYLPFLPLAVPALAVFGAGFLMLAPCLLMLFQWARIKHGFDLLKANLLPARTLTVLGVGALMLLPLCFLARTTYDRVVLHRALDQLFTPAQGWNPETYSFTSENNAPTTHPTAVRRALDSLIRIKHGESLPFITPLYNRIVFDGLILPNDKIEHAYIAFFGKNEQPIPQLGTVVANLGRNGGSDTFNNIDNPRPHNDVTLTDIATTHTTSAPITQTELTLTATNNATAVGEFTTEITLPTSAIITDFALKIDGEWKPGKIFEQKSALWVYQQIRDTSNADPSILYYRDPKNLNLRIFPVPHDEPRQVRFTVSTPTGNTTPIIVEDQSIPLSPETDTATDPKPVLASDDSGTTAILPASVLSAPIKRTPYLHLIQDYSKDSQPLPKFNQDESGLYIDDIINALPESETVVSSSCNYRATLSNTAPLPPRRGGFVRSEALRHALTHGLENSITVPNSYPIITLVFNSKTTTPTDAPGSNEGILALSNLIPDTSVYYQYDTATSTLTAYNFKGEEVPLKKAGKQSNRPIHLLRPTGGEPTTPFAFLPTESTQMCHWFLRPYDSSIESLTVDTTWSRLTITPTTLDSDSPFAQSLASFRLRERERLAIGGGALGGTALASAKASKTLVPGTTYLVMDTSWQWKAAQQAEKKKMKGHKALEMIESSEEESSNVVPEPSRTLLLLVALSTLLLQRRRTFLR